MELYKLMSGVSDNAYDDLPGCIVQSLNDGYADYAFNRQQVNIVKSRLNKFGKTSMLIYDLPEYGYYHLIPVEIWKLNGNKELKLRNISVSINSLPENYMIVYKYKNMQTILKAYNSELDYEKLIAVAEFTNNQNEFSDSDDEYSE